MYGSVEHSFAFATIRINQYLFSELEMDIVLRKYGNSTVAVLPPAVLRDLGLSAGQTMRLDINEQGEIVLSRKRKFTLADLIAQCDPKASVPNDLALCDTAKPTGKEVW